MHWIDSLGGPLMLMPVDALSFWHGSDARETGPTDYDRACAIHDVLGVLSVGGVRALVFGDEPMSSAWLPMGADGEGVVIQWSYANDQPSLLRAIDKITDAVPCQPPVDFEARQTEFVLMDTAWAGREYLCGEFLLIRLAVGWYEVRSYRVCPDESTCAVLHQFVRQC